MAHPEKRHEILRAALEQIAAHGFHEAPIATIAERAGVGAGTIYRYFANKDLLINELFLEIHAKISATLADGHPPQAPIRARFLHLGTTLLRYFLTTPLEFRFLEQYFNSPYGVAFRRDRLMGAGTEEDLCRRLLEEGVRQQIVKDLPLAVLFSLAFGPLLSVARDHIAGFVHLDEAMILQTVQACWDGLKR